MNLLTPMASVMSFIQDCLSCSERQENLNVRGFLSFAESPSASTCNTKSNHKSILPEMKEIGKVRR